MFRAIRLITTAIIILLLCGNAVYVTRQLDFMRATIVELGDNQKSIVDAQVFNTDVLTKVVKYNSPRREMLSLAAKSVGKIRVNTVKLNSGIVTVYTLNGAGFMISNRIMITAKHVVEDLGKDGATVSITFPDGNMAGVIKHVIDPNIDVAVLLLDRDVNDIALRDTRAFMPGDQVWVIGHPFKLGWLVSAGVVSGTSGTSEYGDMQIDAHLNPGNSGGPVLSRDGGVVGMATSVMNGQFGPGIGFAISAEKINSVLPRLVEELIK